MMAKIQGNGQAHQLMGVMKTGAVFVDGDTVATIMI